MPQMSPMPWMVILILSLISMYMMCSLIYFQMKIKTTKLNNKNYFNQKISW